MRAKVAAIILAAGSGRRMGQPKLFLESGGRSFLELAAGSLESAGIRDVIAVVREEDKEQARALAKTCRVVVNEHPGNGPLSSLRAGLDAAPDCNGYLVMPVDHPFVRPETLAELAQAFQTDPAKVVKPSLDGRDGHPVIIPKALAAQVTGCDVKGGLAVLIKDSGLKVVRREVSDQGILKNINTSDDMK